MLNLLLRSLVVQTRHRGAYVGFYVGFEQIAPLRNYYVSHWVRFPQASLGNPTLSSEDVTS